MFNWKKIFKKRIDPKDIPVLEDIIDDDDDEFVNKDELVEDYPHLFSNEDEKEEEASSENDEFVIDLSDEIDDKVNSEINSDDSNVVTLSSVINKTDTPESDVADTEDGNIAIDDNEDSSREVDSEIDSTETDDSERKDAKTTNTNFDLTDPAQLDIIVNKVVEQLMPELEQQLHSLIEKTLAEKSPEELANLLNIDNSHSSDKS